LTPTAAGEIAARLIPGIPLVLSGGEPLLHQDRKGLQHVLDRARHRGCEVHVETNGTIAPVSQFRRRVDVFAVSPKMAHAGMHRGRQDAALHRDWAGLARKNPDVFLKVVVRDRRDVVETVRMADELGWPRAQVWVMPLGTTTEELLARWPEIAAAAAESRINASQRLHVLAWGDTKGT